MTIARCRQVNIETTPYYHVIGRCVRRAFLCGLDASSGKNYEHRRQWVIQRLELLCSVFAIELCSYTILENHYHLVTRLAPDQAESWTDDEVMARWEKVYGIATTIAIGLADGASPVQRALAEEMIEVRRQRLTVLSLTLALYSEPSSLYGGCLAQPGNFQATADLLVDQGGDTLSASRFSFRNSRSVGHFRLPLDWIGHGELNVTGSASRLA